MEGDLPEKPRGTLARGLRQLAGTARRQPTPQERIMWARLRDSRLAGYKFRQQHPIHSYRVDFYCAAGKLIVELDGPIHDKHAAEDAIRQAFLESFGYRFLRFSNDQVTSDVESVLTKIRETLHELTV
jgi:very-short-patch-repair endonuclease